MHKSLAFRRQGITVLTLTVLLAFFLVLFLGTSSNMLLAEACSQGNQNQCEEPGIDIAKYGPDAAHIGDTITYTFEVTNTGNMPLYNVSLEDDVLGSITNLISGDSDSDGMLDIYEVWTYEKSYTIPADTDDPLVNNVEVSAESSAGFVYEDDQHMVEILIPEIEIVKTVDNQTVLSDDNVVYSYTVTNTGNCTLYDVTVTDDLLGYIGSIDSLDPGESYTFSKETTITADTTNIGTVVAYDELGGPDGRVEDSDDETVITMKGEPETPLETPITTQIEPAPQAPQVLPYTGTDYLLYFGAGMVLVLIGLALRFSKVW